MMLRLAAAGTTFALALLVLSPAFAGGPAPRGRIFRAEPLESRGLRLFATFLTRTDAPVLVEDVLDAQVFRLSMGGARDTLEHFAEGAAMLGKHSVLQPLADTDLPVDVVLVVSGNRDRDRTDALNGSIRKAALLMLQRLPKSARVNLVWVTDTLSTYVAHPDKEGELSDHWQYRSWCRDQDARYYESLADEGPAAAEHPCGLLSDRGGMQAALGAGSATTAFDGFYPPLYGLPWALCTPNRAEPHLLESRRDEPEELELRVRTGALDVAARLLAAHARPKSLRVLLVISDGKDGYLLAAAECSAPATEACRVKGVGRAEMRACVRKEIERRVHAPRQKRFVDKARRLLPLLRAAGVRLDAVLVPTALPHEAERMKLLSLKSGGTYRFAEDDDDLLPAAEAAVMEVAGALVADVVPDDPETLPRGEAMRLAMSVSVPGPDGIRETVHTSAASLILPEPPGGIAGAMQSFQAWLEGKVGKKAARIIMIVLAVILAMILLFIVYKVGRKLLALPKKLKGKAKGAIR